MRRMEDQMDYHIVSYPAVISEEGGKTKVHFPDLPAADVLDDNKWNALMRAEIGLALTVIDLESHHEEVPKPTDLEKVIEKFQTDEVSVQAITTDLDEY